ncbi:hypothetical protein WJX75_000035 [Coccomyxa subellipsoidea]|uniref:L domain-like protein n=1 Tax=Coccomyxa subellipsoidea TaxID=248742 RepID=A0ABR2YCL0_9CHLO
MFRDPCRNLRQRVYFHNNNLSSLPPLSGTPSNVRFFGISNNSIEAPLDDALCNHFPKLEALIISKNKFYGAFPECLGNIGTLVQLILSENNITGPLPPSFGENLPNMTQFKASSNPIGGILPDGLTKATGLSTLQLSNASFVGTMPSSYGKLAGLTTFDFSNNILSGTIPQSFERMLGLMLTFDGSFNQLTGAVPNFTTGAFHLSLKGNNLQTLPEEWRTNGTSSGFTNIMELSNNSLSGLFPYNLNRTCKFLRYLDIAYNHFSGPLPSPPNALDNFFANLFVLNASHNHFSG